MKKDSIEKREVKFFKLVIRLAFVSLVLEAIVGVLVGLGYYI